jgi:prepilin-type N-terminal cleavage/methylation domain-containing protein
VRRGGPGAGFTLVEVVVAVMVLAVGLGALALGFQQAASGMDTGGQETTAVFLAERRLEELRAVALADWASAALGATTTTEYCPATGGACTATATTGLYRRVTAITDNPGGSACAASCKRIRVTVFYRALSGGGDLSQERHVTLVTVVASRT